MVYNELKEESTKIRKRIEDLQKKLDDAFQINQMQKRRLIHYEDELISIKMTLRNVEKRHKKPSKFSLKNIFKFN